MTPDPRFFDALGPVTLAELASLTGAQLVRSGDGGRGIQSVAVLAHADHDCVTYVAERGRLAALNNSTAGACFLRPEYAETVPAACAALLTPFPQAAYARAAARLHRSRGVDSREAISSRAQIEEGAVLGPGVVVGFDARIGAGTVIGPNAVIGPGVTIGRDCEIGPGVSIGFAMIGDRVRIQAGAVIGAAGFGAAAGAQGLIDMPQLGRVILQDGVTLGANSCVDRGAFEDTVIGENSKIDNLVHIAHNVRIGRNCAMAAFTGISGSVWIGDGVQFGGKAGVADHVVIGDGARVAAAAAVMRDIPPGEVWGGFPAKPIKRWMRETAWLAREVERRKGGDS